MGPDCASCTRLRERYSFCLLDLISHLKKARAGAGNFSVIIRKKEPFTPEDWENSYV
jgi:hypothetical protein